MNKQVFSLPDAELIFYPAFFTKEESDSFFDELTNQTPWQQRQTKVWGKLYNEPRLTAWYGEEGTAYSYSGITLNPLPWTPVLLAIKTRIETVVDVAFNSVLLNLYRDGNDSVGWHSDNEASLGTNPVIGSVSLGATRKFQLQHRDNKELRQDMELTHASLLVMQGTTQHFWKHQLPKTKKVHLPRINLTFRVIKAIVK